MADRASSVRVAARIVDAGRRPTAQARAVSLTSRRAAIRRDEARRHPRGNAGSVI
jgi:hypothetical protein